MMAFLCGTRLRHQNRNHRPNPSYWVGPYAGYSIADVTYDYSLLAKAWEKVFVNFPEWDAAYAPYCVWSGPMFEYAGATQFTLAGKDGADQKNAPVEAGFLHV
jgi:hypothetical protein